MVTQSKKELIMSQWTKERELLLIEKLQNEYVDELREKILKDTHADRTLKYIYFTSPTGTGKTKMMSKLINSMPEYYFVVTTLSKGQLYKQIDASLKTDCLYKNYIVYGSSQLTRNSILREDDVIQRLPYETKIVWLRDEGHIHTNNWTSFLEEKCFKIVDFSATNKYSNGVVCNFTQTMMLRTVEQKSGNIEDALDKLLEVKEQHKNVQKYNPCALFRVTHSNQCGIIQKACRERGLKYISIVDNDNYDMSELCEDDNEYDVIINKQKIVEGIDIRRAHVLWIENEPGNASTTIQIIGRCRRNALLWRDDIDILDPINEKLLEDTRICYVFYNVVGMGIATDENGELAIAFCPYISVEKLRSGYTISVFNGQMKNGLYVEELKGKTGDYEIKIDKKTGFNYVDNGRTYEDEIISNNSKAELYLETVYDFIHQSDEYWKNLYNDLSALTHKGHVCFNAYYMRNDEIKQMGTDKVVLSDGHIPKYASGNIVPSYITEQKEQILKTIIDNKNVFFENSDNDYLSIQIDNSRFKMMIGDVYKIARKKHENQRLSPNFIVQIVENNSTGILDEQNITINNNRELALIGIDDFYTINTPKGIKWKPERTVTAKLSHDSKLLRFIENEFSEELTQAQDQLFTGVNNFNFDTKCNACLGYCVEYYAKYLILGQDYLGPFYEKAQQEYNKVVKDRDDMENNIIVVRACMLKYKELMAATYGAHIKRLVKSITVEQLIEQNKSEFIKTVIELGTKTAEFIRSRCNIDEVKVSNHSFNTGHVMGLADVVSHDTIIDIKCTNNITRNMLRQVLSYYWLSTFRFDLDIKNLIVFDAVSGKFVEIKVNGIKHKDIYSLHKQLTKSPQLDSDYEKIEKAFQSYLWDTHNMQTVKSKIMIFQKDNLTFYHTDVLKVVYQCSNERRAIEKFEKDPDLLFQKTCEFKKVKGSNAIQLLYCDTNEHNSIYYKEKKRF